MRKLNGSKIPTQFKSHSTYPECGSRVLDYNLLRYPPIQKSECTKCKWNSTYDPLNPEASKLLDNSRKNGKSK
jgi:hypothetical protein